MLPQIIRRFPPKRRLLRALPIDLPSDGKSASACHIEE
jgi:hypothetical protein